MTLRLILWLSIVWLAPLVVGLQVNEARFKKGIAVGVTIPCDGQNDPEITAALKHFRRGSWMTCIGLVAVGLVCMFLPTGFAASMTVWSVWLVLLCVLPCVPYARCNLLLKRIKTARGWKRTTARTVTVDLSAIPAYRRLSVWCFALSLLPLVWNREVRAVVLADAGAIVLFYLIYRYAYRKKSERVDENTDLTRALTQLRLHGWGKLWVLSAWMLVAMNWLYAFTWRLPFVSVAGLLTLSAIHIIAIVRTELRVRRLQQTMTAGERCGKVLDEDEYWIFGQFYYNPDDRHLIVNSRTGLNTTVNLARPVGRVWRGFAARCLLGCLAVGPWLGALEKRPVTLEVTEQALICAYGNNVETVPLTEITSIQVLDTLPDDLVRTSGTSMEHLQRGKYFSHTYGNLRVCLDPTAPPFLLVETAEQGYLLAARDPAQTGDVYAALQE